IPVAKSLVHTGIRAQHSNQQNRKIAEENFHPNKKLRCSMTNYLPVILLTASSCFATVAHAQDRGFFAEAEIAAGRDIVPPDVIESGLDQDRLEGLIQGNVRMGYDINPLLQVNLSAGAEVFPVDNLYNRYRIGPGIRGDIPMTKDNRTRLRLGAGYEYVFGD